jgi:hypothetical protein
MLMAEITYKWIDRSRHILQVNYPRDYTWDDYHRNIDQLAEELQGDDAPLYIIDVYEMGTRLPANIVSPHWKRTIRTLQIGYVVYVSEDKVLIALLRNFLHTIDYKEGKKYNFAKTIAEAQSIIEAKL